MSNDILVTSQDNIGNCHPSKPLSTEIICHSQLRLYVKLLRKIHIHCNPLPKPHTVRHELSDKNYKLAAI